MSFCSSFQPELLNQKDMRWLLKSPTIPQPQSSINSEDFELKQLRASLECLSLQNTSQELHDHGFCSLCADGGYVLK